MQIPTAWKPLAIAEIQETLAPFTGWVLCGGHSIDLLLATSTRAHGDIDIGVLRSSLTECLRAIGPSRIFLCNPPGNHLPWDGAHVDPQVHDIWISDPSQAHWILQIMVFDDENGEVTYRRDSRIRWPRESHAVAVGGVPVLNPLITLLYKTNKPRLEEKEVSDVIALIRHFAEKFSG